jgi:hypothetical protein
VKPLSAIEAVTPAIERTKLQLFKPFRFWHWARLAFIVFVTWDFSGGGGGGNFNIPSIPLGDGKKKQDFSFLAAPDISWNRISEYLPWIILGVGILLALILVFIFIACVFRFVLFDAVLHDKCEIRAGWKRYQEQGFSYFLWSVCLGFSVLFANLVLIGGPVLAAWNMGIFDQPRDHILLLILGGLALLFLMIALFVTGAIISMLAKDFAIPIMALENVGILGAWRRMRPMLAGEKLSFAAYIGMKIVLALGSGILFGIITLIAMLLLMIPMGIAGVGIYLLGIALGLEWNLLTITITVLLGAVAVHIFLAVMAFISVPPLVFFQSYVLHFLGSRYPLLGEKVFPPPPPPLPETSPIPPGPEPAPAA